MRAPLSLLRSTPLYQAAPREPARSFLPLNRAEMRDVIFFKSDGPRGYGSQLAPWQGGAR